MSRLLRLYSSDGLKPLICNVTLKIPLDLNASQYLKRSFEQLENTSTDIPKRHWGKQLSIYVFSTLRIKHTWKASSLVLLYDQGILQAETRRVHQTICFYSLVYGRISSDHRFLRWVACSDERAFHVSGIVNTHNTHKQSTGSTTQTRVHVTQRQMIAVWSAKKPTGCPMHVTFLTNQY